MDPLWSAIIGIILAAHSNFTSSKLALGASAREILVPDKSAPSKIVPSTLLLENSARPRFESEKSPFEISALLNLA